jgi:hypothetical protein
MRNLKEKYVREDLTTALCPVCHGLITTGIRYPGGDYDDWITMPHCSECDFGCCSEKHPFDECISKITLLSTVVAPVFETGTITMQKISTRMSAGGKKYLDIVKKNFCGHPLTNDVLKSIRPDLPEPVSGFWDGEGWALAIRPKGGVRAAAQSGDTSVSLNDVEAVLFRWTLQ